MVLLPMYMYCILLLKNLTEKQNTLYLQCHIGYQASIMALQYALGIMYLLYLEYSRIL